MMIRLINHKDMAKMQVETMFDRLKEEFMLAQQRWIRQAFDETNQEDKKRALVLLSAQQKFRSLAMDLQFYLELEFSLEDGKSSDESSRRKD